MAISGTTSVDDRVARTAATCVVGRYSWLSCKFETCTTVQTLYQGAGACCIPESRAKATVCHLDRIDQAEGSGFVPLSKSTGMVALDPQQCQSLRPAKREEQAIS